MTRCPYADCKHILGDLDAVMDKLAKDKVNGKVQFNASCCGQTINAYREAGT